MIDIIVPKFKILFDAGPPTDANKTGVGYYVEQLFTSLSQYHSNELDLYGYYFSFLGRGNAKSSKYFKLRRIRLLPGKLLNISRRLGFQPYLELLVPSKYDAVVFTNYVMLPTYRKMKKIVVVYDLCYLDHPEFLQNANLAFLNKFALKSIQNADSIITISNFTKDRILHHYPALTNNIIVTPIPPIEYKLNKTELPERLSAMGIKKHKYILYIGTIEPRKNITNLVKAYSLLDKSLAASYSLVLAGGKGWKDGEILLEIENQKALGLDIVLTGRVSENEKSALYNNAKCLVQPSHYEGFGMPILEAMQNGLPVAVSNIPVFHEVAGNASIYFDQNNPQDIASKISSLLIDKSLVTSLKHSSVDKLSSMSWKDNADKVFDALHI